MHFTTRVTLLLLSVLIACVISCVKIFCHEQDNELAVFIRGNWSDFKQFEWFNEPRHFELINNGRELHVQTLPESDFWRKSLYNFVHNNGHLFFRTVPSDWNWTLGVRFELQYGSLYDQAGLMVRLSDEVWLKTGIEFVEGSSTATNANGLQVSAVYTNDQSDWSIMSLDRFAKGCKHKGYSSNYKEVNKEKDKKDSKKKRKLHKKGNHKRKVEKNYKSISMYFRVRKLGNSYISEFKLHKEDNYQMIRLGYLNNQMLSQVIQLGVFACSPSKNSTFVKFSEFSFSILRDRKSVV